MSEPDGLLVARVSITRYLTDEGLIDHVSTEATDGNDLGLAEALGMMTLGQHTLVEIYSDRAHAKDDE